MTTGYKTVVVAEARQRLADVVRDIDGVVKIQKQAKEQEQYNIDPSPLYSAARLAVVALAEDFDIFKKYVDENQKDLYATELNYYKYMSNVIEAQIENFQNSIIIPSLTAPIAAGSKENDTDVGMSFTARVITVPDADTLIVRQFPDGEAIPRDHTVRVAGIDAPESGTVRGKHVADKTSEFWVNRDVIVFYDRHTPNDLYGRVLGTIYLLGSDGEATDTNFAIWSLERCYSEPNTKFGKNHFVDKDQLKLAFSRCAVGSPTHGTIKVTSLPTHAVVRVGKIGESLSQNSELTPCEITLPVGEYIIALTAPGCGSLIDEISVSPGLTHLPVYNLPKLASSTGIVSVDVAPVGKAVVLVDGNPVGVAPLALDLPVDVPVTISASVSGYQFESQSITPKIGEIKKIVFVPT